MVATLMVVERSSSPREEELTHRVEALIAQETGLVTSE
jgi:hypothetical protein